MLRIEGLILHPQTRSCCLSPSYALAVALHTGVNTPKSTSHAPLLNSEYTVLMTQGYLFPFGACSHSATIIPVTSSGAPAAMDVDQRMMTSLQVCQMFIWL